MRKSNKKKMIFMASFAAACMIGGGFVATNTVWGMVAGKNVLTSHFSGEKYHLTENYQHANGVGTLFLPHGVGSNLQTKQAHVGRFAGEFTFLDGEDKDCLWQYTLTFTDTQSEESFAVVFDGRGEKGNVYVKYGEEKCGIYYENGAMVNKTSTKNKAGVYNAVDLTQSVRVDFNPNTKQVKINGRTLWDFSKAENDGRGVDFYLQGFAKYDVRLELTKNTQGTGRVLVHSMLGCDLSTLENKDTVAPTLFADVKYHAVVDEDWTIPTPVAVDLTDGEIAVEKVQVSVISSTGTVVLDQAYTSGLEFTPQSVGTYYLFYKVMDEQGNQATEAFDLQAFDTPTISYNVERAMESTVYGTNTETYLPVCRADDELFRSDVLRYVQGKLLLGTQTVADFTANENYQYRFEQAGTYTLTYYVENTDVTASYTFEVRDDVPALSLVWYDNEYETGTALTLQPATISLGQESKQAECTVISPNGKTTGGNAIVLSEFGKYTIRYETMINNKPVVFEKYINAGVSVEDVLNDQAGVSVQMSSHDLDGTLKGLKITSYPRTNVTFSSAIDFSAQEEGENFIELVAIPRIQGTMEYNHFIITLTDTEDVNNKLIINCYSHDNARKTFVSVATAENAPSLFKEKDTIKEAYLPLPGRFEFMTHENLGVTTWHTFTGNPENILGGVENAVLKLRLDYQNRKLYAYAGDDAPVEVADFNDESFIQMWGKAFTGFTDGKAYCSVQYDHRKRMTLSWEDHNAPQLCGSYLVTKFGGYDYTSGKIEDLQAPIIKVNAPETVSKAVVNKAYKVFDAIATDNTCGFVDVRTAVVFNYGQPVQTSVKIENGAFIPKVAGTYTIVYLAQDAFGNRTECLKTIEAVLDTSLDPVELCLQEKQTEKLTGNKVYIRDYSAVGGVGNYAVKINAKNEDVTAKLYRDETGTYFIPEKSGDYEISYTATDYVGNVGSIKYTQEVVAYKKPIFSVDPIMPLVLTAGVENALPSVEATDYYAYPAQKIAVKVYVKYPGQSTYEEVQNIKAFLPDPARLQTGDVLSVKYEAIGSASTDNVATIEKQVAVANFNSTKGNVDYAEYFVTHNATIQSPTEETKTEKKTEVHAVCGVGDSTLIFGKKVLANGFTFKITVKDKTKILDELEFFLVDSENGNQTLRICLYGGLVQEEIKYTYSVNGGAERYNAEYTNGDILFRYIPKTKKVNLTSTSTAGTYVFQTESGEEFNGFTSGYVFVRMRVKTQEELKIHLRTIGNQTVANTKNDSGSPVIVTEKGYGGTAYVGQEYEIPKAFAGDVLAFVGKVTVSVRDENGNYLTATDNTLLKDADASKAYMIVPQKDGKYTINYSCKDSNDVKSAENNVNLYVVKPIQQAEVDLSIDSAMITSASVGDAFTLPTATPSAGANVFCVVFGPNHEWITVQDNVAVFEKQGTYTVSYTVLDDIGNAKTYNYYVAVK